MTIHYLWYVAITLLLSGTTRKNYLILGKITIEVNWISEQKVPLIIKGTNLEKNTVIKTTGGQIDNMPTILNLMGIEGNYVMGRDLLNTNENSVIFRDGSFIKDNIYYMQGVTRI